MAHGERRAAAVVGRDMGGELDVDAEGRDAAAASAANRVAGVHAHHHRAVEPPRRRGRRSPVPSTTISP